MRKAVTALPIGRIIGWCIVFLCFVFFLIIKGSSINEDTKALIIMADIFVAIMAIIFSIKI